MNCYSLNNVGPSWERIAGAPRFLTVYAVASLATVLTSYRFNPAPSVGASGAIFGLVRTVLGNLESDVVRMLERAMFQQTFSYRFFDMKAEL